MTCQGCVRSVTNALQGVPGVASALVDLDTGRAEVRWKPDSAADARALIGAVTQAGFEAETVDVATEGKAIPTNDWSPLSGWRWNLVLGIPITALLMLGEWAMGWHHADWFRWTAFTLATVVQLVCGARFYRGAWNQLRVGSSNMDTLVALGSTMAFGYSAWALFTGQPGHLYFMEAVSIITLISVGHWLEARVSVRAAGALRALINLTPPVARRLDAAGNEAQVPVADLHVNDRVLLKPGDRVPVDGDVAEGASTVDESMLTGESLPVDKARGAKLYAGTVNQDGRLVMTVRATGEATALANIIAVVQRAQSSRASIQRLGDRVSSVFVPIVVLIAIATALWWGLAPEAAKATAARLETWLWPAAIPASLLASALIHAAAVLIIACPCAMGLATPVAIMAGTNVAARLGILIRDGEALEKSGTINAVVFDKTGTLTRGKISVTASLDLRAEADRATPFSEIAVALAAPSQHPLSRAVAATKPAAPETPSVPGAGPQPIAFGKRGPVLRDWRELRGSGVQARVLTGGFARLGSLTWLASEGVETKPAQRFADEWSARGATILGVAMDAQLIGLLALKDELKPHAASVVTQLTHDGQACFLITGDNARTAAAIATQAGIPAENVFAEVRPEQKAELIGKLQQRGLRVAFVGDGINDAPALKQANLGIAVAQASDVAREAADVILLNSDIQSVPEALALARATLRTIRQNLFWAFFYNAAGIPLAALGFLSPVLCAAAMGFSDLIVIGNALRLHRFKRHS
jgi:Cu+-exporting ATPase